MIDGYIEVTICCNMRIIQLIGTPGPKKHLRLQKNKRTELVDSAGKISKTLAELSKQIEP